MIIITSMTMIIVILVVVIVISINIDNNVLYSFRGVHSVWLAVGPVMFRAHISCDVQSSYLLCAPLSCPRLRVTLDGGERALTGGIR